jgi:uncharacterized repeat protein (TIGR03803 family)
VRNKNIFFGILAALAVTLFVACPRAAAQTETVLYSFDSPSGYGPIAGLAFDSAGNLYGATASGGIRSSAPGTIFKLTPASGGEWAPTWLEEFSFGHGGPSAVIFDAAGNLYFATAGGGAFSGGAAYELSPKAGGGWSEKRLYSFGEGKPTDGVGPNGPLVFDSAGNLYGTTYVGGGYATGEGTVFELTPGEDGAWTEKVLHNFGPGTDGYHPEGNLIVDSAGDLYGTTSAGGLYGGGTVFELTREASGGFGEKILHSFEPSIGDGSQPQYGLVLDTAGNLYGTTRYGGPTGDTGTVFELSLQSDGKWTEKILDGFQSGNDSQPLGNLIFDKAGNLYGTTLLGGPGACANGCGTVYELTPNPRGGWTENVLHNFGVGSDGAHPYDGLIFDAAGNLYGTTNGGGAYGWGTVFEITP